MIVPILSLKSHVLKSTLVLSLQLAKDLLHPSLEEEKRKHKLKRLVQSPNSYFMDVKCPGKERSDSGKLKRHAYNATIQQWLLRLSISSLSIMYAGCAQ